MGLLRTVDGNVPEDGQSESTAPLRDVAAQSRSQTLRPVSSGSTGYLLGGDEKEHLRSGYGCMVARLHRTGPYGYQRPGLQYTDLSGVFPQSTQRLPLNVQQRGIRTPTRHHFRQARIPAHPFFFLGTATLCFAFMER